MDERTATKKDRNKRVRFLPAGALADGPQRARAIGLGGDADAPEDDGQATRRCGDGFVLAARVTDEPGLMTKERRKLLLTWDFRALTMAWVSW